MVHRLRTTRGNYWLDGSLKIKNTLIYLTGYPASGKLTIAKKICEITDAFLVDNHTINNPIFQLVRKTGKEKLNSNVWEKTKEIRNIVLSAMVEVGNSKSNYVMTNVLVNTDDDKELFNQIKHTAKQRNALFVPIKIICSQACLISRVANPDRAERLKLTDKERLSSIIREHEILQFEHKNALEIHTDELSANECASKIIQHTLSL